MDFLPVLGELGCERRFHREAENSTKAPIWQQGQIALFWCRDGYGRPDRALYVNGIYLGQVDYLPHDPRKETPWRAWLMTTDEGDSIGWFDAEQKAKDCLVDRALMGMLSR